MRLLAIALMTITGVMAQTTIYNTVTVYNPKSATTNGPCGFPLNAFGNNFIALSKANWRNSCGQKVAVLNPSTGISYTGFVTDMCTDACNGNQPAAFAMSVPMWTLVNGSSPTGPTDMNVQWAFIGNPSSPSASSASSQRTSSPIPSVAGSSSMSTSRSTSSSTLSLSPSSTPQTIVEQSDSSSQMMLSVGAIAGIVIGAVAAVALLAIAAYFCLKRRGQKNRRMSVSLPQPQHTMNRSDSSTLPMIMNTATTPPTSVSGHNTPSRQSTVNNNSNNRLSSFRKPVPTYNPEEMQDLPRSSTVDGLNVHSSGSEARPTPDASNTSLPRARSPFSGEV